MSDRRVIAGVVLLGAALAAYLYWTSDERQIRRLLDGVADAVTQEEPSGVAGLAEVAGLNSYLAPDVTLEPGEPFRPIVSAQDVVSTVGRLRAVMPTVRLEISNVEVSVNGASASVSANTRLTLRDREGTENVEARSVAVRLEERGRGWIITAARAVGDAPERE